VLGIAVVACKQQPAHKGKLIIIGGGSRPESIISRIIDESGLKTRGYGVVLPMSSSTPDSSVYYAAEPFRKAGVTTLVGLHFKQGEPIDSKRIDSIRNARLIYITGGDQNLFMDVAAGTPIETAIADAYHNGSVVAGTSAGAAVMCRQMITGNALRYPEYESTFSTLETNNLEIKPGLGLMTNVLIDQHFLIRSRYNRLLTGVIDFPTMKGIGIDESTAIVVSGDEAEVIGESQVVVVTNPKESKREMGGKLAATGLTLTIYLPGDKFSTK